MATYPAIVEGLHVRFRTVVPTIPLILPYEPQTAQKTPCLYTVFDSYEDASVGPVDAIRYRILHRLLLLWQDNERAEVERMPYITSIRAAVKADPHLGSVLVSGVARISDALATVVVIGGTMYWATDFYSDVLDKNPT